MLVQAGDEPQQILAIEVERPAHVRGAALDGQRLLGLVDLQVRVELPPRFERLLSRVRRRPAAESTSAASRFFCLSAPYVPLSTESRSQSSQSTTPRFEQHEPDDEPHQRRP